MNKELHIFIIWQNAQYKKNEILKNISLKFKILEISNIKWDEDNFSNNITRFYGEKLPPGSFKELECGTGRFTIVVVLDTEPKYKRRKTSKGAKFVNAKMFDAKEMYRAWTGGGHKIHASNDTSEAKHDLVLLLGKTVDSRLWESDGDLSVIPEEKSMERNLTGCIQWESLEKLFQILNETSKYLVLRNYDGMPCEYYLEEHGDIDILVQDKKEVLHIINAVPMFNQSYRTHYKVNIDYKTVRFDVRFVGDDYYDKKWQKVMLDNRKLSNGFYIPSDEDYKYSFLYHALMHKDVIVNDYKRKIEALGFENGSEFNVLQEYLKEKGYEFTEPRDLSVFYNNKKYFNTSVRLERDLYWLKVRAFRKIKQSVSKKLLVRIKNAAHKII